MNDRLKTALFLAAVLTVLVITMPSLDTDVRESDAYTEDSDPFPNPIEPLIEEHVRTQVMVYDGVKYTVAINDKDKDWTPDNGRYYLVNIDNCDHITYLLGELVGITMANGEPFPGFTDLGGMGCIVTPEDYYSGDYPHGMMSDTIDTVHTDCFRGDDFSFQSEFHLSVESLKNIGDKVFENSDGPHEYCFDYISGVEYVGYKSFANSKVTAADFPNLRYADQYAFSKCSFSDDIYFPNLERIAAGTFKYASTPGSIILPSLIKSDYDKQDIKDGLYEPMYGVDVDRIELDKYPYLDHVLTGASANEAFLPSAVEQTDYDGIDKIKTLHLPSIDGNTLYGEGYLDSYGYYHEDKCRFNVDYLDIPNVTTLAKNAFYQNPYLDEVYAPNLQKIKGYAFCESSLDRLYAPNLSVANDYALYKCYLDDFGAEDGGNLTSVGFAAFAHNHLTEINLTHLDEVDYQAFSYNDLTDISFAGSEVSIIYDLAFAHNNLTHVDLAGVEFLCENVFSDNHLTAVDNLDSLVEIGSYAFEDSTLKFECLSLPKVDYIGDYAFSDLETGELYAPNLTYVGDNAFGSNRFDMLTLGKLEHAGNYAFNESNLTDDMVNLAHLRSAGDYSFYNTKITKVGEALEYAYEHAFEGTGIESIEGNLRVVYPYAFCGTPLKHLDTPKLEYVGDYSFYNTQITKLMTPELCLVGAHAFQDVPISEYDLTKLEKVYDYGFAGTNLSGVLKLDTLWYIGPYAFVGTSITELILDTGDVKGYIDQYAFSDLTTLEKATVNHFEFKNNAFYNCINLAEVTAPNLDTVGDHAFENCGNLVRFVAPYLVQVGDYAFKGTNWNNVIMPICLYIGNHAFQDSGITSLTVTNPFMLDIGEEAFVGCKDLAEVTLYRKVIVGDRAFAGTSIDNFWIYKGELGKDVFADCEKVGRLYVDQKLKISEEDSNFYDYKGRLVTELTYGYRYFSEEGIFLDEGFDVYVENTKIGFPGNWLDASVFDLGYHTFNGFVPEEDPDAEPVMLDTVPLKFDGTRVDSDFLLLHYTTHLNYEPYGIGAELTHQPSDMSLSQTIPGFVRVGVEKLPVASVEMTAFQYRDDLRNMCFDNIEHIGKYAFQYSGLEHVNFTNTGNVRCIDYGAFFDCEKLTGFSGSEGDGFYSVHGDELYELNSWGPLSVLVMHGQADGSSTLSIPEGCGIIGEEACRDNLHLTKVTMPDSLTEIRSHAFDGLDNIVEYRIPAGVRSIESNAFGHTHFYDGDRELKLSEIPGHTFYGDCKAMYVVPDDYEIPIKLDTNGKDVQQPYPEVAVRDENGNIDLPDEDPVCTGYTFIGWNTEPDGTGQYVEDCASSVDVISLYAIWEIQVYEIVYENLKGADNSMNPLTYTVEDDVTIGFPTRTDAEFAGWYWNDSTRLTSYITWDAGEMTGTQKATAAWLEIYEITYIGLEGAKVSKNPTYYKADETFTLNNPTKEGYDFIGWTGNGHNTPTKTMTVYKGTTGDLEFTAHWYAQIYHITYTGVDGADNSMNPLSYTVEDEFVIQNPTMEGYDFAYWLSPDISGHLVEPEIPKGTTGDLSFDAKWDYITYSITYEGLEGADNSMNPTEYDASDYIVLSDLTRDGFTFLGWTGNGHTEPVKGMVITVGTTGDLLFTAHWEEIRYDILYVGVHNAQNDNPATYKEGDSFVLKDAAHDNFEFLGWTGNGTTEPTKGLKVEAGTTGDLVFFAHWKADSYNIYYEGVEGTDNSANPTTYKVTDSFVLEDVYKDGYTFMGWTGNGTTEPVRGLKVEAGTTGDLLFTAHWQAIDYRIVYDGLEGAYNPNPTHYNIEDSFVLADPVREAYEFLGWTGNGTTEPTKGLKVEAGTTGDLSFTAHWAATEYTITYIDTEGAENPNPSTYTVEDSFVLKDPTRGGFEFLGWTVKDTDEPVKGIEVPAGTTGDLEFKANWNALRYTITYLDIEGADNRGNPTEYTAGDSFALRDPVKDGFEFLGWTGNGITEPTRGLTVSETTYGDLTFTAVWEYTTIDVTLDMGDTVTEVSFDGKVVRGSDGRVSIPAEEPVADGYMFIGWYTAPEGGMKVSDGDLFEGDTLYAAWAVVIYDITYTGVEGADNSRNPIEYTVEDSFRLYMPMKEGYEFLGWTGNGITEPTRDVMIKQGTTGDLTFDAHMEMIEYIIIYGWVLGADNSDNPTTYTVEDSFVLADASREGFDFLGWTGNGVTEPTKGLKVEKGTTGFLKFTANWAPTEYTITYEKVEYGVNDNPGTYTVMDLPLALNQPVTEGFEFMGWDDGKTVSKDVVIKAGTTGDLKFTATWKQIVLTVTVDTDGGKLTFNGTEVKTPYKAEYVYGTEISAEGDRLTVGDDAFVASHYDHDVVTWSIQDNAAVVDRDLAAMALFSDSTDRISSVEIDTMPVKTDYLLEERFDPTGMTLKVTHRSGATETVSSGYTYTPAVFISLDTEAVTVTYQGFETECPVTVSDAVDGIAVSEPPAKTDYIYGESFDPYGMTVKTHYLSGKTEEVTDYTWTPEVFDTIGDIDVVISYQEFTAVQPVTVKPWAEPVPDETDRYVRVHVDEAGIISDDAAAAAAKEIRIAAGYNPGADILVDVPAVVFESVTIPKAIAEAVADYRSVLNVMTRYGAVELNTAAMATDGLRADIEVSVTKPGDSSLPEGFLDRGAVYDITLKADGKVCSQFDAPVTVRIHYPVGAEIDSSKVRVYHIQGDYILAVDDAECRMDRYVTFDTDHFSEYAIKVTEAEYDVDVDVQGSGSVIADPVRAEEHVTVLLTVKADPGFVLKSLTVDGKEMEVKDGKCVFEMPAKDVAVKAVFEAGDEPVPEPVEPEDGDSFPVGAVVAVIAVVLIAIVAVVLLRKK